MFEAKDWVAQFPLSTKGRAIVNQHGERFRLRSVNWYGASVLASFSYAGGSHCFPVQGDCSNEPISPSEVTKIMLLED